MYQIKRKTLTIMKNLTQIKSELTTKEVSIFESLVRLGDSIQFKICRILQKRIRKLVLFVQFFALKTGQIAL